MCAAGKSSLIFICCLLLSGMALAKPYPGIAADDYQQAVQLADKLRPALQSAAGKYHEDAQLLEAIVFPELIRYSLVFDVVETGSLMTMYTRFGNDYADFSIGYYQMKPSFAESIEAKAGRSALRIANDQLTKDEYKSRKARVERLLDPQWQNRYLIAFIKCFKSRKLLGADLSKEDTVRWYATAYNAGWTLTKQTLTEMLTKKYFHLDVWQSANKFCYADIALHRYKELRA